MNQLQQRIIEISKKLKLSHIGSNLSCLPVLEEIYKIKKPDDIVILDNAHAHSVHLVVRFKNDLQEFANLGLKEEDIIEKFGIHCDRQAGCNASGGSLGHGLGIAIGYALADPKRDVYVIVSEGSMMEGSSWEALATIERLYHEGMVLSNLHIYTNFNGYSAVAAVDRKSLRVKMETFCPLDIEFRFTDNGEGFEGLQGHYRVLSE